MQFFTDLTYHIGNCGVAVSLWLMPDSFINLLFSEYPTGRDLIKFRVNDK